MLLGSKLCEVYQHIAWKNNMTLPEIEDICQTQMDKQKSLSIGKALKECVRQANSAERLTCGVVECAKLLACNSDNVMLCVLPAAGANDVTVHIQHTLIEAFCWENDIRLLKIDDGEKLKGILNGGKDFAASEVTSSRENCADVSCILIEYPKGESSSEDEIVAEYLKNIMLSDVYPKPLVQVPA